MLGGAMMGMIVAATFLISFLNVGFIAVLQRLMRLLDHDIEGNNPYPWRTELVYTCYYSAVTAFIFVMAVNSAPTQQLLWINGALILMMSYTDAVKTRINIILPLVITVGLFFAISRLFSFWLILTLTIGMLLLLAERQWFFPFDQHPVIILSVKAIIGGISWAGLTGTLHLALKETISMFIVYLLVTAIVYRYMVTLRREHLNQVETARNVIYDNLTHAYSWLSFRSDANSFFENYSELSIIAMDIDNFKQINDTYGHLAGNVTLQRFAAVLEAVLAKQTHGAKLYRTGGEEFTILYPGVTAEAATLIAEELQEVVRGLQVKTEKGETIHVTISMGVENRRQDDKSAIEIFNRADRYLYVSKRNGKDQISFGTDE